MSPERLFVLWKRLHLKKRTKMRHCRRKVLNWGFVQNKLHKCVLAKSVRPMALQWWVNTALCLSICLSSCVPSHVVTRWDWNIGSPFCGRICPLGPRLVPKHCTLHKVMSDCLTSLLLLPGCQNKSPAVKRVWQETASWARGVWGGGRGWGGGGGSLVSLPGHWAARTVRVS